MNKLDLLEKVETWSLPLDQKELQVLVQEGFVVWTAGMPFLTESGEWELFRLREGGRE